VAPALRAPAAAGRAGVPLVLLAVSLQFGLQATGCGDSRREAMERELAYQKGEEKPKAELPPEVPPHPTRDALAPVLSKMYGQVKLPDVLEADVETTGARKYELTPGVLSTIRLKTGLSKEDQVRALMYAVAEADAWAYRDNARRSYADLIHKVKTSYGADQKELVMSAYAELKLLTFFGSPEADAAIAALPADVKPTVEALKTDIVGAKEAIWERWMGVKMYARRVVAGDEPFRSVLKDIKKELGKEEPPPRTWMDSMDAPLKSFAEAAMKEEELLIKLTNLRDLRDREEFMSDTHSLWVIEGSAMVPDKAKGAAIDPALGFAAIREDLGGGYNDMTYVFSRKLQGPALKKAFFQSVIYGHLLADFAMLSTAGSDFAVRDEGGYDPKTAIVPDKYDPLYAKCGSGAAIDTLIAGWAKDYPALQGLGGGKDGETILDRAHKCVIEGAKGDIWIPDPKDDKDVEGPAPGSRLGLYQMLSRFENIGVNVAAMGTDVKTEEDDAIDDLEKKLKAMK
jgi:hypothetical protein